MIFFLSAWELWIIAYTRIMDVFCTPFGMSCTFIEYRASFKSYSIVRFVRAELETTIVVQK